MKFLNKQEEKEVLDLLEEIGTAISKTFGHNCEVCISDLDYPEKAVISILMVM